VFDQHIAHVDERMAELAQLKQQLTALRQRCQADQSQQDCGILQGLAAMEIENRPERNNHLG
jgi:Tfp pilus assembly protein PilN